MKTLVKFLSFVFFLSIAIAALFQLTTQPRALAQTRLAENATLATEPVLNPEDVNILAALNEQTKKLVNSVIPSVVSIEGSSNRRQLANEQILRYFFGNQLPPMPKAMSLGSGVIVSKQGHILTNFHVIGGADRVEVSLNDGRKTTAALVGGDERLDLAVLKINLPNLKPLPLGDSDKAETGERVFAIGNPFGVLTETVTDGIISAKSRTGMSEFVDFIQTNAVINPGNSGGPLVNIRGEIIGINTQILGDRTGSWQGYGFAIPSNTAKVALQQILAKGRIARGYLGVVTADLDRLPPDARAQLGIRAPNGAILRDVEADSPASDAGLEQFDVVTEIDGKPIKSSGDLVRSISLNEPGKVVTLKIERRGTRMEVPVRLGDFSTRSRVAGPPLQPRQGTMPPAPPLPNGGGQSPTPLRERQAPLAGIETTPLTQDKLLALNLPPDTRGVVIQSIAPNAPSQDILRPGDVIETIQNQPIQSAEEFEQAAEASQPGKRVVLGIVRDGERMFIPLST